MADNLVIVVEGLDELQEALKQFPSQLQASANEVMKDPLIILENEVKQEGRADTGDTVASVGSEVVVGIGSEIVGKVGSNLDHAPYALEYGRKPGKMPPVQIIEEWAIRHGMPGAGFVIARAIGARGVSAPHTLSNALASKKEQVVRKIEEGITKVLRGMGL